MNSKSTIRLLGGKLGLVVVVCFQFITLEVIAATPLPKATYLPLDVAQKMANAALTKCAQNGHRVGAEGHLTGEKTKHALRLA